MTDEIKAKVAAVPTDRTNRNVRRRKRHRRELGRCSYSTETAAAKLDTTEPALRQRLRRFSRLEDGQVVARLGMGVIGRKLGSVWRIYFEEETANAT